MSKKSKAKEAVASAEGPTSPTPGSKQVWKLMDRGSSAAAAILAHRASELTWRAATGKKPPSDKKSLDSSVREIALWAFIGGGLSELVRVLIRRSTASYWVKSTGHLPPGMKAAKKEEAEQPLL